MDKDFFKDIKDRISNPFFISFIISWLICNWPIVITVMLYKSQDLKNDHFVSFYDMIRSRQSTCNMIIIPLTSAIGYCTLFPWIKALVEWMQAWASSWGDSRVLHSTKAGVMPFKRYIELRDIMQKDINDLKILVKGESEITNENTGLRSQVIQLKAQLTQSNNELLKSKNHINQLRQEADVKILNGDWRIIAVDTMGSPLNYLWRIIDGEILKDDGSTHDILTFVVSAFGNQLVLIYMDRETKIATRYFMKRDEDYTLLYFHDSNGYKSFEMKKVQ